MLCVFVVNEWAVGVQMVDGGKGGGEQILTVFEKRLSDNIKRLEFDKILRPDNVKRIVEEADGYQPHLIAPEMGYRRLLQECIVLFKVGWVSPMFLLLRSCPSSTWAFRKCASHTCMSLAAGVSSGVSMSFVTWY
jgi:hypothetical protein